MTTATHGYVGLCPNCRGIKMAAVDTPAHAREVAKETAACIRAGLTVERWTVEDIRAGKWCLPCTEEEKR
jgi:hypothetical protein